MIELDKQGFRPELLKVINPDLIQIGNQKYVVSDTGEDEELKGDHVGVHVDVITFIDLELQKKMDVVYITVEPNKSTPIQGFGGPRIFIDSVMKGKGTWVGVSPEGEVVTHEFDGSGDEQGLIVYGQGWIGSWIAGDKGLEVVEICVPPYKDDNTISVAEIGDKSVGDMVIPQLFQATYQMLMGLS